MVSESLISCSYGLSFSPQISCVDSSRSSGLRIPSCPVQRALFVRARRTRVSVSSARPPLCRRLKLRFEKTLPGQRTLIIKNPLAVSPGRGNKCFSGRRRHCRAPAAVSVRHGGSRGKERVQFRPVSKGGALLPARLSPRVAAEWVACCSVVRSLCLGASQNAEPAACWLPLHICMMM